MIGGTSLRDIASAYGLQPNAVLRHSRNHLATELQQAAAQAAPVQPTAPPRQRRAIDLGDGGPTSAPISITSDAPPAAGSDSAPDAEPLSPYAMISELRDTTVAVLRRALASGDGKLALSAAATAVQVVDRLAKLVPMSAETAALPLAQSPEWHRMRTAIVEALADHPEARLAVVAALSRLEPVQ